MFDEEIVDDLAADINPWGNFYIIADEESEDLAYMFLWVLERHNIFSFVVVAEMRIDFNEDDLVLVISQNGREDYISLMVSDASKSNVKVYAICSDFRSHIALLADEIIVIDEIGDFEQETFQIVEYLSENLSKDAKDDDFEVDYADHWLR